MDLVKCSFCNRELEKATRENINGVTWLYPDEEFICEKCLKFKSLQITPK